MAIGGLRHGARAYPSMGAARCPSGEDAIFAPKYDYDGESGCLEPRTATKPGAPPSRVRRKGVLVYVVLDSDKLCGEEIISYRYPESAVALSSDFLCYFTDV